MRTAGYHTFRIRMMQKCSGPRLSTRSSPSPRVHRHLRRRHLTPNLVRYQRSMTLQQARRGLSTSAIGLLSRSCTPPFAHQHMPTLNLAHHLHTAAASRLTQPPHLRPLDPHPHHPLAHLDARSRSRLLQHRERMSERWRSARSRTGRRTMLRCHCRACSGRRAGRRVGLLSSPLARTWSRTSTVYSGCL